MKLRFRFTILTLIALTTVVAHTGAKRFAARRLATSSGKVQSTWIPFVIQVGVPEQQPRTFGSITANAITMRRYAGICGMYFLVASYVEMDMSKPIQIQLHGYHDDNTGLNSILKLPLPYRHTNHPMHPSRGRCFAVWSIIRRDGVIGSVTHMGTSLWQN